MQLSTSGGAVKIDTTAAYRGVKLCTREVSWNKYWGVHDRGRSVPYRRKTYNNRVLPLSYRHGRASLDLWRRSGSEHCMEGNFDENIREQVYLG